MSEALRLANVLENEITPEGIEIEAAAELRRLHDLVEEDSILLRRQRDEIAQLKTELAEQARVNGMGGEREARLMALNGELVEALRRLIGMDVAYRRGPVVEEAVEKARAALAKVGDNK